ncbi:MAG: phenylalanine--tRNA ligase subunit beta [Propionibacteriaceae bacterium]|jgi:phenylalanyl-tRNA synthetase beta chain|nr:phenylalanine--tRNA ligase subunit beta [Propionibacteriaceae bacterium]
MRAPYSWLAEHARLSATPAGLADAFTDAGLQVEKMDDPAAQITGLVVVGKVLSAEFEPQKNGKTISWCRVDTGEHNPPGETSRGVVCGAPNVVAGAFVPVVLPGAVLPGGFVIASRKTYGHLSDGMICAEDELGLGEDHNGIIILPDDPAPTPGEDALALLGAREVVYEIDVTPVEGYCLSIRGLAREAAQITGGEFVDPYAAPVPPAVAAGYPVELESADCPLFVALTVTGVDPARPTPRWLADRLRAMGMRSVSLAVDITNYVMLESGQPLHAYDQTTLRGPIRVRKAHAGERIVTLDHVDRALSEEDLLITDDSGPIGLAGVMGGLTTELTTATTEILLEAAWFTPTVIGRTYRRHHLPSEASRRFERGVDSGVAYAAARRAAELLRDLAGGVIAEAVTVAGAPRELPGLTGFDPGLAGRILGAAVADGQVAAILRASGVTVVETADTLTLTPPTWRGDLRDPYDYIEEVGRKLGFRSIRPRLPVAPAGRGYSRAQIARRAVLDAVTGAGFTEVIPLPFVGTDDLDRLDLAADDPRRSLVRLANPLSEAQPYLRTTLLPGLFASVNRNTSRSLEDLALVECGSVFRGRDLGPAIMPDVSRRPSEEEIAHLFGELPGQPRHLAGVVTGDWLAKNGSAAQEPATWRHAVFLAEVAAGAVGATLVRRRAAVAPWHPGRCAELGVVVEGEFRTLGWAGELHPRVVDAWGLPARTCAVECDLDALIAAAPAVGQITALSKYPATKQDVALVVDVAVPAAAVEAALTAGAGELLESVALFDVSTGAQGPEGQKSLAYGLVFRSAGRTLKESEASAVRDRAVAEAARATGAVLRS